MDSELTSEASVKALDQGVATTDSPAFAGLTVDTTTLAVDSTNNRVGVGTSSPSTVLDVQGAAARIRISDTDTAGTTGIEFVDSSGTKDAEIEVGNSTQYLAFKTATAERLRITGAGVVEFKAGITEDSATLSGTSTTINLATATNFVHNLIGNTTYTFINPAATGNASAFTLKIRQDSSARTITWPASVDWAGGTAPTLTSQTFGTDVFVFYTIDGGTTYYGFVSGQGMA
jgi:hypothetical protein